MNKELLLTDLTSRLRYKTVIYRGEKDYIGQDDALLEGIDVITGLCKLRCLPEGNVFVQDHFSNIIPCLRPMSSMTEEEKKEFELLGWKVDELADNEPWAHCGSIGRIMAGINWLLAHHFDFNGLIPLGLAVEVTEEYNPYKQ